MNATTPPSLDTARAGLHRAGHLLSAWSTLGLTDVVASPGSRNTPLLLAARALGDALRTHVILDERAAAFFALGLARRSGRPVALTCTSGSAPAHYLPAVVEAYEAGVPLLVVTADRPPERHGTGAPQTTAQANLYQDHTRARTDLGPPPDGARDERRWLATTAARLWDAATGPPAGPVHLNVPFREPLWTPSVDELALRAAWEVPPPRLFRARRLPPPPGLDEVATFLAGGRRGVIVCGPRTPWPSGEDPLPAAVGRLSRALGWPVIAEPASQLRFSAGASPGPGAPPLVSTADAALRVPPVCEAMAPDRVLRLGRPPTSKATGQWLAAHGRGHTTLVTTPGVWPDPDHTATHVVVGDEALVCHALASALEGHTPRCPASWARRWRSLDEAVRRALDRWTEEDGPAWEGAIARWVTTGLPPGAALHAGNSMPVRDLDTYGPPLDRAVPVLVSRGVNGIDGALATILGESLAPPGRPVVALLGDLTFLHDLGALPLAARLHAPTTVVVVRNGGGGIFQHLPIRAHADAFEDLFLTPHDADIGALCQAAGVAFRRVTAPTALPAALAHAAARPGPCVLEVSVDRRHDAQRRQQALTAAREAARAALVTL